MCSTSRILSLWDILLEYLAAFLFLLSANSVRAFCPQTHIDPSQLLRRFEELRPHLEDSKDPEQILNYASKCSLLVADIQRTLDQGADLGDAPPHLVDIVLYINSRVADAFLVDGDTTAALRFLSLGLPFVVQSERGVNPPAKLIATFVTLAITHGLAPQRVLEYLGEDLRDVISKARREDEKKVLRVLLAWFRFQSFRDCSGLSPSVAQLQTLDSANTTLVERIYRAILQKLLESARAAWKNRAFGQADSIYECVYSLAKQQSDTDLAILICLEAGTHAAQLEETRNVALRWLEKAYEVAIDSRNILAARQASRLAFLVSYSNGDLYLAGKFARAYARLLRGDLEQDDLRALTTAMLLWVRTSQLAMVDSLFPLALASVKVHPDSSIYKVLGYIALEYGRSTGATRKAAAWLGDLCSEPYAADNPALLTDLRLQHARLLLAADELENADSLVAQLLQTSGWEMLSPDRRAKILLQKGNIQFRLGYLQRSLGLYRKALTFRNIHPKTRAAIISNYAYALATVGQYRAALKLCDTALRDNNLGNCSSCKLDILSAEAVTLAMQGKRKAARKLQAECVRLSIEIGDSTAYVENLLNLAANSQRLLDFAKADSLYDVVATIAQRLGQSSTLALALANRAVLRTKQHELEAADSLFTTAFGHIHELVPDLRWRILYQLALLRRLQGKSEESLSLLKQSVAAIEKLRNPLSKEEFKLGFVSQRYQVYADLVTALLRLGQANDQLIYEAFSVAEQSKARVFVELFGKSWRDVGLSSDGADVAFPTASDGRRLVDSLLADLPPKTAFLEFVVAPTAVHAFVLDPDVGDLRVVTIDVSERWLEKEVKLLYDLISSPFDNTEPNAMQFVKVSSEVYDVLMSNILPLFQNKKSFLVVPDGVLFYLPLGVLCPYSPDVRLDFRYLPYLAKDYEFSYAPSARAYILLRNEWKNRRRGSDVLIFADPVFAPSSGLQGNESGSDTADPSVIHLRPLPYTKLEAELVSEAVGRLKAYCFVGEEACETRFRQALSNLHPLILHVASHGVANNETPKKSGILLGRCSKDDDGFLSVQELGQLHISARLTVLSCCQTALGKLYRGEGVDGLARAFLLAGSQSVLVTLWSIADEPSARLMGYFYRRMFRENEGPVEALAVAKRKFTQHEIFSHPFFWAPFEIVGFAPAKLVTGQNPQ